MIYFVEDDANIRKLVCYALEKEGKIIVIQPDNELGIKRTEKSKKKLENGYKLGYQKAEEIIKKNLY